MLLLTTAFFKLSTEIVKLILVLYNSNWAQVLGKINTYYRTILQFTAYDAIQVKGIFKKYPDGICLEGTYTKGRYSGFPTLVGNVFQRLQFSYHGHYERLPVSKNSILRMRLPRLRCQTEASMSRPSQTESTYVQTVPDGKCLCPDFRAFIRLSCVHVQTFVRSCPDFRAFDRLSCVHQTFVRSSDFRAFMSRFSCVHVQIFVRSTDFRAFTRLSCVHVQTFVRSPNFRAFMFRLSCVHVQTFVRSTDFRAFMFRLSCVFRCFQTM